MKVTPHVARRCIIGVHLETRNTSPDNALDRELVQRLQKNDLRPNLLLGHIRGEPLLLTVQTGQTAKYRSTKQTVSKPPSHN